jgi:L-lactate dehydrogenase
LASPAGKAGGDVRFERGYVQPSAPRLSDDVDAHRPVPWAAMTVAAFDVSANAIARPSRVAVVGAGNVGASFAYALVLSGLAPEIVLIDADTRRAEGEAMDLTHAVPFAKPTRVWAGTLEDTAGAAVTVISAGTAQRPGETRLDLVKRNDAIFASVVPQVAAANPDGIIVVATNPVDVLTYRSIELSGLPSGRVLGSGTILDTARFRAGLAERLGLDARSVHAYVIGEHGDSEVPVWSSANVGGMPLFDYCAFHGIDFSRIERAEIFEATRDAAYAIIERKGATYYAVAAGLMRIVEAILRDQQTVLPVSSLIEDYYGITDVCLSIPSVVGRGGVERLVPIGLSAGEATALRKSAAVLRSTIASLREDD